MNALAGFTAVIGFREKPIQELIRVSHRAGDLESRVTHHSSSLDIDLFLDSPELSLDAQQPQDFLAILRGWGTMNVHLQNLPHESRGVRLVAELHAPHVASLQGSQLTVGIEGAAATLVSLRIDEISGGPFSAQNRAFLESPLARVAVELALRRQLDEIASLLTPFDLDFLQSLHGASGLVTKTKSIDGALVVGLETGAGGSGDLSALGNTAITHDISMWEDGQRWLAVIRERVEAEIRDGTEEAGVELERLDMELENGAIAVSGRASKRPGYADFSLDISPRLVGGTHTIDLGPDETGWPCVRTVHVRDALTFRVSNVSVHLHLPWWAHFLEVFLGGFLTFGIGAMIMEAMLSGIRGNAVRAVATHKIGFDVGDRLQEFTLPFLGSVTFRTKLRDFDLKSWGVFSGLDFRVGSVPAAAMFGPRSIPVERLRDDDELSYRIRIPFSVHPDDPALRVRWTIVRESDQAIVLNLDDLAGQNTEIAVPTSLALGPNGPSSLVVTGRIYRALGPEIEDFFNRRVDLEIRDRLDRSHPYVRWRHYVNAQNAYAEVDGTYTRLGLNVVFRKSRLHRTDFPGCCTMVGHYSITPPSDLDFPTHPLEYLDALPFPLGDIERHREELCDYCFYGGPTRNELLLLPG